MKLSASLWSTKAWPFWTLLVASQLLVQGSLLLSEPLLLRDDLVLLAPLEKIESLPGLLAWFVSPQNPDFQPLRDLSYLVDISFARLTGFRFFHLHNVALWLLCCGQLLALARRHFELGSARVWVLLFSLHPVYAMSVGWVSARKHLLAFLFFLLLLRALEAWRQRHQQANSTRTLVLSWLAFAGSLLAQPINILFPVWLGGFWFWQRPRKGKNNHETAALLLVAGLFAVMLLFLWINHAHYAAFYAAREGAAKQGTLGLLSFNSPGQLLLALGRYCFQLLLPIKLAVLYSESSRENVAGLVLFVATFFLSVRALGAKVTALAFAWFVVLLGLVLLKIQTIFLSDSYLLAASLAFWYLAATLWQKWKGRKIWASAVMAIIVALTYSGLSWSAARTWASDDVMWENSYRKEPNCFNSMNHALLLFKSGQNSAAVTVADFHFSHSCRDEISQSLYFITVFHHPGLSIDEKRNFLTAGPPYASRLALLTALELNGGKIPEGRDRLADLRERYPAMQESLHRIEIAPLYEALNVVCGKDAKFKHCDLLPVIRAKALTRLD